MINDPAALTAVPGCIDADHAALAAACKSGVALCTIIRIEGSFSRRVGAQLAIHPDGSVTGSLADGCLERQLVSDARTANVAVIKRYGSGSPVIDFRLPCGGGLNILVDPAPDREACRNAVARLKKRQAASLIIPANDDLTKRHYIPALKIAAFGEGPELAVIEQLAKAAQVSFDSDPAMSGLAALDTWTAVVLLFHDHERERDILARAVRSDAFYIGAQGGETARNARILQLISDGIPEEQLARIRGPIGSVPACRTPLTLALSILSEVAGQYEQLVPHR